MVQGSLSSREKSHEKHRGSVLSTESWALSFGLLGGSVFSFYFIFEKYQKAQLIGEKIQIILLAEGNHL